MRTCTFRRRVLVSALAVSLPLMILLITSNLYSMQVYNEKIADSNRRTLEFRVAEIEHGLSSANDYLTGLMAANSDVRVLSAGAPQLEAHLASYNLITQMRSALPSYTDVGAFFVYSATSNIRRDTFSDVYEYDEKRRIQQFVWDAVSQDTYSYSMRWFHAQVGDKSYLFRFYGGRGTYLVGMVSLDRLSQISATYVDDEAVAFFAYRDQPLTAKSFVESNQIQISDDERYFFTGTGRERYMILADKIESTDVQLYFAIRETGYFGSLDLLQAAFLILSIVVTVLIPVLQLMIARGISRPVVEMQSVMKKIQDGELDAKMMMQSDILEFQQMNGTFNAMMTQIKDLKIEAYEREIDAQKAQLRYLQLQIRPHFFLNCLKSLYAMAETGDHRKIQQMILAFSKHIRYIFADNMDFVPLSHELSHIQNYLEMHGLSAVHPPVCHIDVDPALLDLPIPPLSLQTFVENSVKHDTSPDHALEIEVRAAILRGEDKVYADLTVSDNGSGFSNEVIQQLNSTDVPVYSKHHVGINNIKKRMSLIYGDAVLYAFFNRDVGSISEVFIPLDDDYLNKGTKGKPEENRQDQGEGEDKP